MLDLISIGDATIDHIAFIDNAAVNCRADKKHCQLCLNYGDKIAIKKYVRVVAGNAANMAVGSALLDIKAGAYIELGDDLPGHEIYSKLKSEGVNMKHVRRDKNATTNTSFVVSFQGDRTILVYHYPQKYNPPKLSAKWLYVTSMGTHFLPVYSAIVKQAEKNPKMKVAFNPGTHQFKAKTKTLLPMLKKTTVLFVNKEEALTLTGGNHKSWKTLLKLTRDLGPASVVITNGRDGAYTYDGQTMWHLREFPGEPVERTGAGDSFGTATVAAMIKGHPLEEAIRWGAANASSVVKYPGPQAGLLTTSQIEKSLRKNKGIRAQKLK